jgi:ribosomal protein S18 acetylase RimI-like enzyme
MTKDDAVVIHFTPSQADDVCGLLARAFHDDPMSRYLIPTESQRLRVLPWLFGVALRYATQVGNIYTTPGIPKGVAIWIPAAHATIPLGKMIRLGLLTAPLKLGFGGCMRFLTQAQYLETLHKEAVLGPHWYLAYLVVDPLHQRQGLGHQLLQPLLKHADTERLPCYLETQQAYNLAFYHSCGFTVVREGRVPRGGPVVWAMLRAPQERVHADDRLVE